MAKKIKRNRFAGSDATYSTKKFLVCEYVSTGRDGIARVAKKYIRKSPKAYRERKEIWGF